MARPRVFDTDVALSGAMSFGNMGTKALHDPTY